MKPDERLRALRMQALMDMLAKRAKQRREEKKRQKLSENSGPAMAGLLTY
jgi:hypothetical protein